MTLHSCKYCNYSTTKKATYDIHLTCKKHKTNYINSKNINISSKDNSGNNIVIDKIVEVTNTQNTKIEELCKKIEELEKSNKE